MAKRLEDTLDTHDAPAALPRALLQLVRHAGPPAARSRLRLHRRQRQSGGAPDRRGASVPRARASPPASARRPWRESGTLSSWFSRRRSRAERPRRTQTVTETHLRRGGRGDRGISRRAPDLASRMGGPARGAGGPGGEPSRHRAHARERRRGRIPIRGPGVGEERAGLRREPRPRPRTRPCFSRVWMRPGERRPASGIGSRPWHSAPKRWSRPWTSASSSTPRASSSRSAIGWPTARSIPTATTCWPPRRGWEASWPSPRATSRPGTGSCWAGPSRRSGAVQRSSPGRAPCSST